MIIKLNILRIKENNIIKEIFTVTPEHHFCFDNKRAIYHQLRFLRNKYSIHRLGYKLIDINYFDKSTTYIFEYNNEKQIPNTTDIIEIKYNPVVGKKYCKKCNNFFKGYCIMRGFKINKKSFYKCRYWVELNVFK